MCGVCVYNKLYRTLILFFFLFRFRFLIWFMSVFFCCFFSIFVVLCGVWNQPASRMNIYILTEIGYIYVRSILPHKNERERARLRTLINEYECTAVLNTDFIALFKTLLFFSMIRINQPVHTHICMPTCIGTKGKQQQLQYQLIEVSCRRAIA